MLERCFHLCGDSLFIEPLDVIQISTHLLTRICLADSDPTLADLCLFATLHRAVVSPCHLMSPANPHFVFEVWACQGVCKSVPLLLCFAMAVHACRGYVRNLTAFKRQSVGSKPISIWWLGLHIKDPPPLSPREESGRELPRPTSEYILKLLSTGERPPDNLDPSLA